ncbi:MBL fold metallo-hydrolase [Radiobacillus kanasensis]|uniref:MBL fold metallo-hydrolase n=1 Tax=Radiobacillus kanasensis TaxID=2844358 RepID=UPI001E5933A7|nr:MBL fold metallo-hydrolase [Radiobacillus kanasensis]UFT99736.1 MBL fold metallo-hydrolase [Radiobacillus kanasensis]
MSLEPIQVQELVHKIIRQEEIHLLDIRRENDVHDWAIEGEQIYSVHKTLSEIQENPEQVMTMLPSDKPVYVVCYKGISAQKATAILREQGMDHVTYLVGGMGAWGEHLQPIKVADLQQSGAIYQFVRMGKGCLSYMIVSGQEAVVIDASRMVDVYLSFANEHGIIIKDVIDSHLHADHISGGRMLAEEVGATYWFPPEEEHVQFDHALLEDGTIFSLHNATVSIRAVHTPGHTIGSTSFLIDNQFLLTGDTLFIQSIGRPDLAGKANEWTSLLYKSLYDTIPSIPHEVHILPTHFSSLDELKENGAVYATKNSIYDSNYRLNLESYQAFENMVANNLPDQPNSYQQIRKINMGQQSADQSEWQTIEAGPNRCAVR